jgi:hypothetical protein
MVLGCSNTYGYGLPEEFTWARLFANKVGKQYINLAQPGDSAQSQVYKAFKYFEEFGHPKIIVGSFPLVRMEMPYVPNKLEQKFFYSPPISAILNPLNILNKTNKEQFYKDEPEDFKIQQIMTGQEDLLEFSKIPHNPDEVIPKEVGIFYTFMFIQILEQYCKSNGIIFIWNIWEDKKTMEYVKENMSSILKNYAEIKFYDFVFNDLDGIEYLCKKENNKLFISNCHNEFKDHKLYYRAADYVKGEKVGHWGIHFNQHLSEAFYEKYEEML